MGARGPKAQELDLQQLEKLGAMHATVRDVAGWFSVSGRTIEDRLADEKTLYAFTSALTKDAPEETKTFRQIFEDGQSKSRCSLRRKQLEIAEAGNVTMLIWLGKQLLGQKDQTEIGASPGQQIDVRIRRTVEKP